MGFGDVKLALVMGLYLGWLGITKFDAFYLVLVAVFLGCLVGAVFGLLVSLVRRKRGAFPFGPALCRVPPRDADVRAIPQPGAERTAGTIGRCSASSPPASRTGARSWW